MAGFIFAVAKDKWKSFCAENLEKGFFTPYTFSLAGTDMTPSRRKSRSKVLAATFGDFISMHPGDNIYFLSNRKLYGIGEAVKVGSLDCKYDNYPNASALLPRQRVAKNDYLTTCDTRARWVFFFKPSPYFFNTGADMDDILRYRPQAFKVLRAFEGLSFIKIDDEENQALREYISLINEPAYDCIEEHVFSFDNAVQKRYTSADLSAYRMDINKALSDSRNRGYVTSEMFLESALLQELSTGHTGVMGHWDYLTHQLIASPFKPLKYIDKIDVFGYRFSEHYQRVPKLITKYLLVELKKDLINRAAVEQTMQYVDWVCQEYASGDYSKIEAYIVGVRTVRNIEKIMEDVCQRSFIVETHPAKSKKWCDLRIVKYSVDKEVQFEILEL